MNKYTTDSIDTVINVFKRKCNMIFGRGYDDNKIIDYVDKSENYFVIRMNDKRDFLFKGKKKNAYQESLRRKGKVKMGLSLKKVLVWFYQMARGIKEILSNARKEIKALENIETREKEKQLYFKL